MVARQRHVIVEEVRVSLAMVAKEIVVASQPPWGSLVQMDGAILTGSTYYRPTCRAPF